MIVGVCKITIHIPNSLTLKDKRSVIRSLKDRLRHKFNVSVAEVENEELWQKAALGIACVSNDKEHASEMITSAINTVKNNPELFITETQIDFL